MSFVNRLNIVEAKIEQQLFDFREKLREPNAIFNLKRGLVPRYYMLRHCREYLAKNCFNNLERAFSADKATESALYINSYYLNLRGALDNLAWILQSEFEVIPGVLTPSDKGKMKVNLFGKDFLSSLDKISRRQTNVLSLWIDWGKDLSAFRDPAAHRVPLYVPPGVITSESQANEFRRLDRLAGSPKSELNGVRRLEYIEKVQQVASYYPIFCVDSETGSAIYNIKTQIVNDHRKFLHVTRKLLSTMPKGA